MTLGEKIASARKEKGMTQEMLAEQLGVTRQAVARWETGKALPGTANLFMLRELLGIPPEEAALEEKTETREPDVQEKAETAGSLTAKQTWVLIAVMAILLWLALQFVGLGAAIGLLILLFISISGLFFIAAGKSGAATAAKAAARRVLYLAAATLLAVLLWCIALWHLQTTKVQRCGTYHKMYGSNTPQLPHGCSIVKQWAAVSICSRWIYQQVRGPQRYILSAAMA